MEGNPFAVCQSPGYWIVLFNCTTKAVCREVEYTYDKSTTTCIILVKHPKSDWKDARETCRHQPRGDLVSITTKEKLEFIIKYLKAAEVESETLWIGLKEKRWVNGLHFTNVFGIFGTLKDDFPKNTYGIIKDSKLDDHDIGHDHMFLCEILMT